MKKILCALLACSLFAFSLPALSWGGLIDNTTNLKNPAEKENNDLSIYQSNGLTLWLSSKFGAENNLSFDMEGLYRYSLSKTFVDGSDTFFTNIIDLSFLKFEGNWDFARGSLTMRAGRFNFVDSSAAVFNQKLDGLSLSFGSTYLNVGLTAGYTGLLNRLSVSMNDVRAVDADEKLQFYKLCYGLLPVSAGISFQNLFSGSKVLGGTSIGLQGIYVFDFDSTVKNDDRIYANLTLGLPLAGLAKLSTVFTFGMRDFQKLSGDQKPAIMLYSNTSLSYALSSSIILLGGFEYASGEQGDISAFKTISSKQISGLVGLPTSSCMVPSVGISSVIGDAYVGLTGKVISLFEPDGDNGDASLEWYGLDLAPSVLVNVFSDFQIGLSAEYFVPFDTDVCDFNNFSATLNMTLAF